MVRVLFSSPMDPERRAVIAAKAAAAFADDLVAVCKKVGA